MGWEDPDSLWAQGMRRSIRRHKWLMALSVSAQAVVVAVMVGLYVFVSQIDTLGMGHLVRGPMLLFGAMAVWGIVIGPIATGKAIRRYRTLMSLVPQTGGRVCIKCAEVLDEDAQCATCRRKYDLESLRDFWEQVGLAPRSANMRAAELLQASRTDGGGRFSRLILLMQRKPVLSVLASAVFAVMAPAVALPLVFGGSVLGYMVECVPWGITTAFMLTGILLVISGLGIKRVGTSRHCPSCGYQQAPSANPQRCPECGNDWQGMGGAVSGRGTRRPYRVAIGVLVAVFGVAGTFFANGSRSSMGQAAAGWGKGLLPTSSLIEDIAGGLIDDQSAWDALAERELTAEQVNELAARLLDRRADDDGLSMLSRRAEAWFVARLAAGDLPADIVERYHDEMVDVSLRVPDEPVVVGIPFTVSAAWKRRGNIYHTATGADDSRVAFVGFYLGSASERIASGMRVRYGHPGGVEPSADADGGRIELLGSSVQPGDWTPEGDRHRLTITSEQAGPLTVRAVLWEIVAPTSVLSARLGRDPEGNPILPPTVTWSKRVELSAVVEVGGA